MSNKMPFRIDFPIFSTLYRAKLIENCKSISTEPISVSTRKEYYKKLGNEFDGVEENVKPKGWDDALPLEAIPGPRPLPVIGNFWRFIPPFGEYANIPIDEFFKRIFDKYGKIVIVQGLGRPKNICIMDPVDMEMVYRNDGAWPIRETVPSFVYYRQFLKPNIFGKFPGLASVDGEEWFKFRSMLNPIFMQPRIVALKVPEIDQTVQDLVKNINYLTKKYQSGIMPDNFVVEIQKWALETMGVLALDTRLGCLEIDLPPDSPAYENISSITKFFDLMYKLDVEPSLWRYISTPNWRKFVKVLDRITNDNMKYVEMGVQKLKNESGVKKLNEQSVLERLIKIDRRAAIVMSLDMMIAGIDTTGKTLSSILYLLSRNIKAQEKLREECLKNLPNKNMPVTSDILKNSLYAKALVKEGLRVVPTAAGNLRTTRKDLVVAGYQIPKGSRMLMYNRLPCNDEKYFKNASEFLPERWLRTTDGELSHKNANPFAYLPFGHGPRTCIGKRMAMMELEIAVIKIVRNFKITWPHKEDAVFEQKLLYGITSPLKLKFEAVDN